MNYQLFLLVLLVFTFANTKHMGHRLGTIFPDMICCGFLLIEYEVVKAFTGFTISQSFYNIYWKFPSSFERSKRTLYPEMLEINMKKTRVYFYNLI